MFDSNYFSQFAIDFNHKFVLSGIGLFSELYWFDELCGSAAVEVVDLVDHNRQVWFVLRDNSNVIALDYGLSVLISSLLLGDYFDLSGYLQFIYLFELTSCLVVHKYVLSLSISNLRHHYNWSVYFYLSQIFNQQGLNGTSRS